MPNGTVELTPDEVEAIEAYGYSPPEAPAWPRTAAPPPVPLAMRVPQRFTATSPPPVFDPMEDMRGQINAMQFKTAQEALDAAERFQYMRAFQRDIDAGVAADKALLRWGPGLFKKTPNVIAPMIGQTRPVPPPAVTNIGGVNVLRSGLRGERATAIPGSTTPPAQIKTIPIIRPDGSVDEENFAVPSASGRGVTIHPSKPKVTGPSASARQTYYRHAIDDLDAALRKLDFAEPPPPDLEAQRTALKAKKKEHQDALDEMFKTTGKAAPVSTKPEPPAKSVTDAPRDPKERTSGTVYNTPKGPLKWTGTGWIQP